MERYNHIEIEAQWAKKWLEDKTFTPDLAKALKPYYALFMFPYPSAEGLHIGNFYAFTCVDVMAKYKKLQGYDVFEPIGFDAFGIHSENYALKIGETPRKMLNRTIANFRQELVAAGLGCDWTREVDTTTPEYYKWTQWIFTKLFEKGLAYQKEALLNWCPGCKTVLADEQIEDGSCERCKSIPEKRIMKQWFFKITAYAQRLLDGLENIDWSEITKAAQKNWIGRSEGAIVKFSVILTPPTAEEESRVSSDKNEILRLAQDDNVLEIFTTRSDTLFGCTYMVLAPEHSLVNKITTAAQKAAVLEYVKKAGAKSDLERTEEKEKTGVFTGAYAINPVNQEKIPIWIADYVLMGYGTGAIMAVPAHDERDFEFAKKYNISIKKVVEPENTFIVTITKSLDQEFYSKASKFFRIETGSGSWNGLTIIYTEDVDKVFALAENYFINGPWYIHSEGKIKKILIHSDNNKNKIFDWSKDDEYRDAYNFGLQCGIPTEQLDFIGPYAAFFQEGVNINSDFLNGLPTKEAQTKIIDWLEKNDFGKKTINYRLRDWCISRQRYWGPPVPVVYCAKCGTVSVPDDQLPVLLPELDKDWEPAGDGRGPLAKVDSFMKTKCPQCGVEAVREPDVMDNFLDSAWYFFRYISPHDDKEIFDKDLGKKWLPVDLYVGGNEHAVLHLMYTRFITMALHDLGLIDFDNPFKRFRANGMILKDGKKMSKSKGNVINPEEYGEKVGYDALKTYLLFLGPLSEDRSFTDSGVRGCKRWIDKILRLEEKVKADYEDGSEVVRKLHQTIKVITSDFEEQKYNTSVARLMELTNLLTSVENISLTTCKMFLAIIAPFAPALAEELWRNCGQSDSIFTQKNWPEYNSQLAKDETIELVVQINGKLRETIIVEADIEEADAKKIIMENEKVKKWIKGKQIVKIIFIKGRLVNIVLG